MRDSPCRRTLQLLGAFLLSALLLGACGDDSGAHNNNDDTPDAQVAWCGDGVLAISEDCDGTNLGDSDCESVGLAGGTLACHSDCTFDSSGCLSEGICGDAVINVGEACDSAALGGQDCTSVGAFSGGELYCTSDCLFDTSACYPDHPVCGDSTVDSSESCDDGNPIPFDGCSHDCQIEGPHLLITELATTPAAGRFLELFNPGATEIPLSEVFLANTPGYPEVVTGTPTLDSGQLIMKFPSSSSVLPYTFVVVALGSADDFHSVYGTWPDYDLDPSSATVPDLQGDLVDAPSFDPAGGLVVVFTWDGMSDLVVDLDYLVFGESTSGVDKTGVAEDGPDPDTQPTPYAPDTSLANQDPLPLLATGQSYQRCDTAEANESPTGGNGTDGHDETSEPFTTTFTVANTATPGQPTPAAVCGY